jgi:hypothetical protein
MGSQGFTGWSYGSCGRASAARRGCELVAARSDGRSGADGHVDAGGIAAVVVIGVDVSSRTAVAMDHLRYQSECFDVGAISVDAHATIYRHTT